MIAMNTPENVSNSNPSTSTRIGWRSGLATLIFGIVVTVTVNRLTPDNTYRMIRNFYCVGGTYFAMIAWWILFSGFTLKTRLVTLVLLGIVGFGGLYLSIRKIDFDGDMRPRVQFTWDPPSSSEQAQKWLSENAPTTPQDASTTEASTILEITDADWPRYCGATGDRIIAEPQCSFDWKTNPPRELWRHPVGDAWSSFAVVGSRLFTQEQRGPMECVVCYEAETGKELWRREDAARYETAQGATGPRATPTVTADAVFALGAKGILNALNPITGAPLWQRNICTDAGSEMIEWGMSGSPLIYGETLIVDAGGANGKAVIAYDRKTGDIVWATGNHQAGYCSPRIETIGGVAQLLIFHGDGLAGHDPSTGKMLWEYPWTNQYKINVGQPMRFENQLFLSSGYDSGCVMIDPTQLENNRPKEVWPPNKNMKLKFNEAASLGDYIYGLDDGILACLNVRTGERMWKGGRYRYGQILLWGDKLLVQSEPGFVAIVEATPEKFIEVTRLEALNERTWNAPVVNRGRLYVRNAAEAACYLLPAALQP